MSSNISQRYNERNSFDIREEKLLAIGNNVRRETGSDVFQTDPQLNEWMQRVKKLGGGGANDLETDDDRAQRLEEEIAAQRKARKERREERKRSLSPLKDSPRSIASGPRSPTHSILSKENRDSNEPSPVTPNITPTTQSHSRWNEREQSPLRGKDESRIDRDKVGEMLLGKNPEFFRQKEKPLGLVKSNDGGDGGLHRDGSSSAMPLPGMRPTKDKTFLTMISQQDLPSEDREDVTSDKSPYNAVSRFAASRSTPSFASQTQHDPIERVDSPPPKETGASTKPVMPWMMPSSTRGAGGFVASAALKRSSTVIKSPPSLDADLKTRPVTMYGRPGGHRREFGGSISSSKSLSPTKSEFSQFSSAPTPTKPIEKSNSTKSIEKSVSTDSISDKPIEEPIPIPPPHKTPLLNTTSPRPTSSPITSPKPTSPPSIQTTPTHHQRTPSPPRLSTSHSTDFSRKRWSPTKSSWLDSALQKATTTPSETPGSPPKRTSSIRPIPPAVPSYSVSGVGTGITKSSSMGRMSALGGMGGRRDVAGITPQSSTSNPPATPSGLGISSSASGSIEARLAALEKKTPPRSTSFREGLKSVSPTPSPPAAGKPAWQAGTTRQDPVKEKLLAARSGLNRTPSKPKQFSDPLKEGILAAKQNLKVQDKVKEKKEDELKVSILNARKGLRRATSKEEKDRPGVGSSVKREETPRRSVTPVVEQNVIDEQTRQQPQKEALSTKRVEQPVEKPKAEPIKEAPKFQPISEPSPTSSRKLDSATSDAQTFSSTTSTPTSKLATSPLSKRTEPPARIQKSIAKHVDPPKRENDSPTPQKKFLKPEDSKSEVVSKPLSPEPSPAQPVKQISLPTPSKEASKTTSFKDSIVNRFNPGLASMLTKGPPMMSRPLPVKSASAPEPSRPAESSENAQHLTHLTKGRARGPKKRNSVKRAAVITEEPGILAPKESSTPVKEPMKLAESPRPSQTTTLMKKPIIKEEPDSPPPPTSSVWNKPRPQETTISLSPEKLFITTFPSTPEPTATIASNTSTPAPRSRQKSTASPAGSMKQRLADLSPLRRDRQSSTTRSLFGNLLRSPSTPSKPKYPAIEIIPTSTTGKIIDKERLFVQAWSIVSRVRHVSLPNSEEHVLYERDMHAFLYMFNDEPGASEPSAIKFLWVGRECKLEEKEGMEFVRLMGDQNADTQVIRQGQETPLFIRALGGVIVTRSGTRRKLDCVEDGLFCVRGWLGGISIDQVDFRSEEFCSGFSYVVKKDGDAFVWHGNGSLSEEIAAARRFAGEISPQAKEMMESDPAGCAELWKHFDGNVYASEGFWRRKYDLNGFNPNLYVVEGLKARQMTQFHLEHVSPVGATVVDGDFVVYVVVPPVSTRSKNDVGSFLQFARELADRSDAPTYVVYGKSHPPRDLKAMFRQWQTKDWPIKATGINLLDVDSAFDVLERERFSIKELQGDSLPLGVDPEQLEYLLSDEEFELVMGMSKTKYDALPGKQKDEVRESGLGLLRELRF